jgi:hypothetical protein
LFAEARTAASGHTASCNGRCLFGQKQGLTESSDSDLRIVNVRVPAVALPRNNGEAPFFILTFLESPVSG